MHMEAFTPLSLPDLAREAAGLPSGKPTSLPTRPEISTRRSLGSGTRLALTALRVTHHQHASFNVGSLGTA